jgi:hypothetical protein
MSGQFGVGRVKQPNMRACCGAFAGDDTTPWGHEPVGSGS